MKAAKPRNEAARLEALRQYNVLDTEAEQSFDDLTFLASQICGTPIALITLVDEDRQWFKSVVGFPARETSRDVSFCAHAILQAGPTFVRDALDDERFADNPLVTSAPHIRFYAGTPLVTPEGFPLGTLCVIDCVPRDLKPTQIEALRALGRQVMAQLELRREVAFLRRALERHKRAEEDLKARLDPKAED
ncbi:MAG TPA: GAF domain-containing protein [Pyrinomonadaceae bacterium]|nr:GAF domain-containing protein [Pyrinomonadaceae bacterium]